MSSKPDEQLPEFLQNMRARGDGYVPPSDAYFAELAERSRQAAQQPAAVRSHRRRWLGAAAAALLLLVAGWWSITNNDGVGALVAEAGSQPSSDELLADIDPEVIDAYVTEQIDEFSLELYAEAPLQE